jgi:hypothetical protein
MSASFPTCRLGINVRRLVEAGHKVVGQSDKIKQNKKWTPPRSLVLGVVRSLKARLRSDADG